MERTERWAKVLKTVGHIKDQTVLCVTPARMAVHSDDPLHPKYQPGQLVLTSDSLYFFRVQRGRSDIVLRHAPIRIDVRRIVGLEVDSDGEKKHTLIIQHGASANSFECHQDSDVVVAFSSALAALSEGKTLPPDLPIDQDDRVRVKESGTWNLFLFVIILAILALIGWLFQWTF